MLLGWGKDAFTNHKKNKIKKPKEPQYYYVWQNHKGEVRFHLGDRVKETPIEYKYIGKLKLETEDD
jgi:hypothetical protein